MKHSQILNNLASDDLNEAIDDDVSLAVLDSMTGYWNEYLEPESIASRALPLILARWNCVLQSTNTDEVSELYKAKSFVIMAVTLHKYAIVDAHITQQAIKAIDLLNDEVALSDTFYRQSPDIKTFLQTEPKPLKRRPNSLKAVTFYRANDIISIQLDDKFFMAYIHTLIGANKSPIIEFYDVVFDHQPTLVDIKKNNIAFGQSYNDGTTRKSCFSVTGLKFLPDLSNQVHLIAACASNSLKPDNQHLGDSVGVYTSLDVLSIQSIIREIIKK